MFHLLEKYVGIYSPYEFTLGGGEKYLSTFIKYFIKEYTIVFFNSTNQAVLKKTLSYYLTQEVIEKIIHLPSIDFTKKYPFDYFIYMNNSSVPEFKGIGKTNIYHCQFPSDLYSTKLPNKELILSYDLFIVNSSFTKKYLKEIYQKYNIFVSIYVLNPVCIDYKAPICIKEKNTFVMIGRIFPHDPYANNKYFDVAIKIFNSIKEKYTLYLIGSVKSVSYFEYLKSIIQNKNIKLLPDISDKEKFDILSKSEYYIQLTGINDRSIFCQEHFGISLIEAIHHNCIPICFGGYSTYLINHNLNGYLIKYKDELVKLVNKIMENKIKKIETNLFSLTNYTFDFYKHKLNSILIANS